MVEIPIYAVASSTIEPAVIGIPNAYIMRNRALETLLFDRNLIGLDFTRLCEVASVAFMEHFRPEIVTNTSSIAELMVLTKGMYYWLHNAYARAFGANLETNFVDVNRAEVSGGGVKVVVRSMNSDSPAKTLLVGDTIASGETMKAAIAACIEAFGVERVIAFSMAGSCVGGRAIAQFCSNNHIEFTIVYGLAAFGLDKNGFDLSFLHPDTVTPSEYRDRAEKVFCGKPVSSVGWDFGSQAQAIRKYRMLCWIEERYWELQGTGVFTETERPLPELVKKERGAYQGRFPSIHDLLATE